MTTITKDSSHDEIFAWIRAEWASGRSDEEIAPSIVKATGMGASWFLQMAGDSAFRAQVAEVADSCETARVAHAKMAHASIAHPADVKRWEDAAVDKWEAGS